ncbi:ABC transporter substrate-binding protein [Halalkalibacter krulwichiae]|uniref:Bacterial extracellular solute-binding protein n=1 Tax=Halalkalibacter krulwichiae TaxID=199441 RepID=A0A1X9M9Q1_9BACI|nr:extracellular solute-binding protein [Halalkalibacter krulwichiae]ARK30136.1 Bacterial extracellular solute-binding protein [Halalkalibacter krulwichiae]
MDRNDWKVVGIFLFLLFMVALTAGCQSPAASPSGQNESNEQSAGEAQQQEGESGEQTLKLLIPNYYNEVEREQWARVIERFTELNPEIDVNVENGDVRVESGSLTALLQSKVNTPDAILMNAGPSRISLLSDAELIRSLDDLYDKNDWQDAIRPFAYQLISGNEHIYELPHMIDAIAHFYNIDVFEEHGVEVPETPEKYIEMLEQLAAVDGVDPITVGARNGYAIGWLFGVMIEAMAGTEKLEEILYGDGSWNDPEIVKVAETLVEWVETGFIPQEAVTLTEADSKFKFLNKQAAIYTGGTYLITDLAQENLQDSVGFFMMPSFLDGKTARPTGGIGQSWVIPTDAKNPEAAEAWLEFILSSDYAEVVYSYPDYNFILASTAAVEAEPAGDVLKSAAVDVEDGSGYNPSVFIGVETGESYFQNLQGLVGGLISAQEAMNNIEEGAQKDKENGFQLNR